MNNKEFYTNVAQYKGKLLVRGYYEGKRFTEKVKYKPYLFVNSDNDAEFTDYKRQTKLAKLDFDSINEAKNFINRYSSVENFNLYGMDKFAYPYINDKYPSKQFDRSKISIIGIDIEVDSEKGMPNVELANREITAITLSRSKIYYTFSCVDFTPEDENHKYMKCKDEKELLNKFLDFWKILDPDVVTGWYSDLFDIPYLHNRLKNLFGNVIADSLSPWGVVYDREINQKYGIGKTKVLLGIAQLDYMILYKKFSYTPQENYRLDTVASFELDLGKIEFTGSLHDLYKKDPQKFIRYNKRDIELVDKMDEKRKFLDIVFAIAYDAGVNFIDAIGTVLLWDVIIHNYLMERKIAVPFKSYEEQIDYEKPEGGYVKEPLIGYHEAIGSWDFDSLYPHIAMLLNISPDTFLGMEEKTVDIETLLSNSDTYKNKPYAQAVNGAKFSREFPGFFSSLMKSMYQGRAYYKKLMVEAKKELEKENSVANKNKVAALDAMQQAKKIQMNAAYGALANLYFRWFDTRLAEAITITGQYIIKYFEIKTNVYMNNLLNTTAVDYVIASDTDSMYIKFNSLKNIHEKEISDLTKKWCNEIFVNLSAYEDVLKMKREAIAINGIWTGKKHYVINVIDMEGVVYEKPKLKITGLEVVKSSTPSGVKKAMKKSLEIILNSKEENDLIELVNQTKKEFFKMSYEEVAFPRGVKNIKKYYDPVTLWKKGAPVHVKASIVYNEFLKRKGYLNQKITEADKIKWCYLKTPNPMKSEVFAVHNELPSEFGLERYIDYDKQFDKAFIKPIEEVAKHKGWSLERKNTLF